MQMISLVLRDKYSAISVCVVNVESYDNYMLIIPIWLFAFCFLLFSMTTLLQLGVHLLVFSEINVYMLLLSVYPKNVFALSTEQFAVRIN